MLFKNILKLFIFLIIISCSSSDDTDISNQENCSLTPDITIQEVTDITESSATYTGKIISPTCESTVTSQGFVYSQTTLPKIDDFVIEVAGENISDQVLNLLPNTKYYVRTFFENPTGVYYSNQVEFTTSIGDINLETKEPFNITFESATSGGIISDDGGSEIISKGVCWSTTPDPTLNNSFVDSSTGNLDFNSEITGLEDETTYYVRAYIKNEFDTFYGNQVSFKTPFEEIIYQGSITLVSQQEVNDFGANGYTVIEGQLQVGYSQQASDINNLEALSSIKEVNSMRIMNTLLQNLDKLSNLSSINSFIEIRFNHNLKNLDGLSNASINSIYISDNDALNDFCGISTIVNNGVENYVVNRNLFNPTEQDIKEGNCSN